MKWIIYTAVLVAWAFILVGCTGYEGPSRGVVGSIKTPWGVGFDGMSTTARTDEKPMGYRKGGDGSIEEMYGTWTDGQKRATGMPAHYEAEASRLEALFKLCAVAKDAPPCNPPTN